MSLCEYPSEFASKLRQVAKILDVLQEEGFVSDQNESLPDIFSFTRKDQTVIRISVDSRKELEGEVFNLKGFSLIFNYSSVDDFRVMLSSVYELVEFFNKTYKISNYRSISRIYTFSYKDGEVYSNVNSFHDGGEFKYYCLTVLNNQPTIVILNKEYNEEPYFNGLKSKNKFQYPIIDLSKLVGEFFPRKVAYRGLMSKTFVDITDAKSLF